MTIDTLKEQIEQSVVMAEEYVPSTEPVLGPVLINMADVEPVPVSWLWWHRFARGRLALLVGRAGLGKSFLTLDMAARITRGHPWPDGSPCEKGSVLLICCEDDPGDTIRVRLDAAGADVNKVHLFKAVRRLDPETGKSREEVFTLDDVHAMEAALKKIPDCRLVVIDPIGSYLGGGTDSHRDNEVRAVLAPVALLAEKFAAAVVIVAHTRKSLAKYADDMALGSRAFTGIVRSVWHLMSDEEDPDRRLLLPGKTNLAKPAPGLAYRIEPDETGRDATAHVVWEDSPVDLNADDLLAMVNEAAKPGPEPEKRNEAAEWLGEQLADGLPRSVQEILDEAKASGLGCSGKTLGRALDLLGGVREKTGTSWQWRIPKVLDKTGNHGLKENNLSTCPVSQTPENKGENEDVHSSGQVDKFPGSWEDLSRPQRLDLLTAVENS